MLELVARLAAADPWECSPEARLDLLAGWERVKAWVEAQQAAVLAAVAGPEPPAGCREDDWVREDVAAALTLSPSAAHRRIETARLLDGPLIAVRDAMAAGRVSPIHALALVEETRELTDDTRRRVADKLLDKAAELTPGRFRTALRTAVVAADPAGAADRRARAQRRRAVQWWAEPDGMATLQATLPAEAVQTIWTGLTTLADGWTDERTLDQKRADALLLLVTGRAEAPPVQLTVTVDLPTLLGLAEHPAELPGYGPLPPALARHLAQDAAWTRWVTDPLTGELLDQAAPPTGPTPRCAATSAPATPAAGSPAAPAPPTTPTSTTASPGTPAGRPTGPTSSRSAAATTA